MRRITKPVFVGPVKVGGDAQISVQSMTKTDTRNVKATINEIKALESVGCEIVRCAVPDMEAAIALKKIKSGITYDKPIFALDVFATVASAASAEVASGPSAQTLPG